MESDAGPVDVVLVKFPGNQFKGEILPALRDLVERDLVRILDLLFVTKDETGSVRAVEIAGLGADLEPAFVAISEQFEGGLLDAEDAEEVAPQLEPGSSVAVLAVENRWLIPFVNAVRNADGVVLDQARVPADVVSSVRQQVAAGLGEGQ